MLTRTIAVGVIALYVIVTAVVIRVRADRQDRGAPSRLNADAIGRAAGTKAMTAPDSVVHISWPRDDVKVRVDKIPLNPRLGLNSVAGFHSTSHGAMVVGNMVVFQDEVVPGMDAAFSHDLQVTALHNLFMFDEPKVYFMHIDGSGEAEKTCRAAPRRSCGVCNATM